MIKKEDLIEAIAECQGQRNPNASTCIKMASYITILKSLEDEVTNTSKQPEEQYSYAENEFMSKIAGKTFDEIITIFSELMEALEVLHPRLYQCVLRKL